MHIVNMKDLQQMNRFTRLTLAISAGVIVGGGISYAALSPSGHSASSVHASVAAGLKHRFAVFATAKHSAHVVGHAASSSSPTSPPLPAHVAASFNDPRQAGINYEPNATEAVYEKPDSSSSFGFWIVPGHRGACVVWETTAVLPSAHANCGQLSRVEKNGMSEVSSTDGPELVFGFLPNGAQSVSVMNADGSTLSAPVVNNAYLIVDSKKDARSLAIQGSAGTSVRQIPAG